MFRGRKSPPRPSYFKNKKKYKPRKPGVKTAFIAVDVASRRYKHKVDIYVEEDALGRKRGSLRMDGINITWKLTGMGDHVYMRVHHTMGEVFATMEDYFDQYAGQAHWIEDRGLNLGVPTEQEEPDHQ